MKRLNQLDGLRFLMIFIIVLGHLEFLGQCSYGNFYESYLHNPYIAVDYFFMLSGFGLMYSMYNKEMPKVTLKESIKFAIGKIKKIYPLYIFSLLLSLPYVISLFGNNTSKGFIELGINFVISLTLLQSASGIIKISHVINAVAWFLSTLFICYMISPLFLKYCKKWLTNKKRCTLALICVILIITILTFVFELFKKYTIFDDLAYGSPYIRCFFLLLGMILCNLYILKISNMPEKDSKTINILQCGIFIISIIYFFMRNTINVDSVIKRTIDVILCMALLYFMSFSKGIIAKLFSNKYLVQLGKNSMYVFLLHYPIRFYIDTIIVNNSDLMGIVKVILILVTTALVSIICKKLLDKLPCLYKKTKT